MILIYGNFQGKQSLFCSARLIFQDSAEGSHKEQHPSMAELIEKLPSEDSLDELKADENFLKLADNFNVDSFNDRVEKYRSGSISFSDLVAGVSADDVAGFFKHNGALMHCDYMARNLKYFTKDPNYDFVVQNYPSFRAFRINMTFFLEERARFVRRDLSQTEAAELSEAGTGFETDLYELDSKIDGTFREVVERETIRREGEIDALFPKLMSVIDQTERSSNVKNLKAYQAENTRLKNDTLQLLGPEKNFNLIESLGDFLAKSKVLRSKISDIEDSDVEPGISDRDFIEIFRIDSDLDARNYLIKGTVARLNAIFNKWDKFYQAPGRRKDSRYEGLQAFRETFVTLKKKWLDAESGDLTDSEYQVHYSLKDILAGAGDVVKEKFSAEYLFEGYPLGSAAEEFVKDNVAEDGKSVKLSELLENSAFHEKFVLQSLLVGANEEFGDLELELFKAGFSESLPYVVKSADYMDASSGFSAENAFLIDVVKRMEYLYPLCRRDAVKNKKVIRKYLTHRIFRAAYGEYDADTETTSRGSTYFDDFFEHFSKYDLSTVKNGEAHKAKILGLKARIDERNRYWLDAQAGVFGDNSRFNAPEDGLYYAMMVLDEFSPLMDEFYAAYQAMVADGYDAEKPLLKDAEGEPTGFSFSAYGAGFDYLNTHHREIFNAIFPKVAPRLAAPVVPVAPVAPNLAPGQ